MRKVKILAYAPYEGLRNLIDEIASNRDDVEVTAITANVEEAVEVYKNSNTEEFDLIISRGGTAELLTEVSPIPVIDISFTLPDILSALNLISPNKGRYAFLGYSSLGKTFEKLTRLLDIPFDIYSAKNKIEMAEKAKMIKEMGYSFVITDAVASEISEVRGMNTILLISGRESVLNAIDNAVTIFRETYKLENKVSLLEDALSLSGSSVLVFDKNKSLIYSSKELKNSQLLIKYSKDLIENITKDKILTSSKKSGSKEYLIEAKKDEADNYIFNLSSKVTVDLINHQGIEKINKDDIDINQINMLFNRPSMDIIKGNLEDYSKFRLPVLIKGPKGTGKSILADCLYLNSPLVNSDIYKFYIKEMDEKAWRFTLNNYNSPLNMKGNTLFFNSIDKLTPKRLRDLLKYLKDSRICRNNQVIFSLHTDKIKNWNKDSYEILTNELKVIDVELNPLSFNKEELPHLFTLYLNYIGKTTGMLVSGIEPRGLEILKEYSWPGNYSELKSILSSLVSKAQDNFISEDEIKEEITKSRYSENYEEVIMTNMDLNQSLDNIIYDIINLKLKDDKSSHSKIASDLKISRTTLWRILKKGKTKD